MRHKKRGRRLGRSSSHRRALLRNLASSLFLTEWDFEENELNAPYEEAPNYPGRITTTLQKAKEVRSLVEKCITIALKSLPAEREAEEYASPADKATDTAAWETWRKSEQWQKWAEARAPAVNARRRVLRMLGSKKAVKVLFEEIAPRFAEDGRTSGYTRVLRLAKPRLGDGGIRAILEFTGQNDRSSMSTAQPLMTDDDLDDDQVVTEELDDQEEAPAEEAPAEEAPAEEAPAEEAPAEEAPAEEAPAEEAPAEEAPAEEAPAEEAPAEEAPAEEAPAEEAPAEEAPAEEAPAEEAPAEEAPAEEAPAEEAPAEEAPAEEAPEDNKE